MLKKIKKINDFFFSRICKRLYNILTSYLFSMHGIKYNSFTVLGLPLIDVNSSGECKFGSDLVMVNSARYSTLGKNNKCKIVVYANAILSVGNKVGMSNTVIVATKSIKIGDNVMIGGGVTIVDSDFHSLNPLHWNTIEDEKYMASSPVIINDNVFIGMDSIILKGVTIGANSIIAAGSVVAKSIPENEIWGGNPATFIKNNEIR